MIPALNREEIERYSLLRERMEREGNLSETEASELSALEAKWNAVDALRLKEATERVETRTASLREENQELRGLLTQKQELAKRLDTMLDELRTEQALINSKIARLLTPSEIAELIGVPA